MASETVVALFDTAAHANAAIRELENSGVPSSSIKHYTKDGTTAGESGSYTAGQPQGFWSWLFGGENRSSCDHTLYNHTVESAQGFVTKRAYRLTRSSRRLLRWGLRGARV